MFSKDNTTKLKKKQYHHLTDSVKWFRIYKKGKKPYNN